MIWKKVKDEVPPFDTLVLVRGKDKDYNFYKYAISYNEYYRPNMAMTQVLELHDDLKELLPVYVQVPFEIEEWIELEP